MDPYNATDRDRLFGAMRHSYEQLLPYRNLVHSLVREYAGAGHVSQNRPSEEPMINLMLQAVQAYTMSLSAGRPRIMLSTEYPTLKAFAKKFEVTTNNLIKEINLQQTIQRWVLDAFFCVGIIKVHMADSGEVEVEPDLWMDPGRPFASNTSIDNFVFDMAATKWSQVSYASDSYRVPFEDLQSDFYEQDVAAKLSPTSKYAVEGDDRLERIGKGMETDKDEFEPMIDLMDVWIPRDEVIYTFAMDPSTPFEGIGPGPLAEMPWNGPEFGPYHLLTFNEVPENIMPSSPAAHLRALSSLANNIINKNAKRARAARRVHTYTPQGADSAANAKRTGDDGWVSVQDTSQIGEINIGGVDPQNHSFMLGIIEMFDRMAGNLQAKMGLGPQANTVGQEKLIHGAVSTEESYMQERVIGASASLIRDLGYMAWHDEALEIQSAIPIDGAEGYVVDARWTPEDREGDFFDYNFDLDVFSLPYQSPADRIQAIQQTMAMIYGPWAQMIAQQGGQVDFQALNQIMSELLGEPRLKEILRFAQPIPSEGPGPQGKPGNTTREYVRRNVSTGGTAQSRSHLQQQAWMGGGSNTPQQEQTLTRPPA